jgi:peptidase M48-like protein/PDZ domain-containing protein
MIAAVAREERMRRLGSALGICTGLALLLAACAQSPAPPAKTAGHALAAPAAGKPLQPAEAADWVRVERVALAVFRGGRQLCGRHVAPTLGLAYANRESFNPALQPAADAGLAFDEHLKVTRIVEGSPAAKAGLRIGDVLMSVGGRLAPSGPGAVEAFAGLVRALPAGGRPVPLAVERAGVARQLAVTPELVCDFDIAVLASDQVNAFTNGRTIRVMSGLLGMVINDDELALVLAHEVGHTVMNHLAQQKLQAIGGGVAGAVLDILAGATGMETHGRFTRAGIEAGTLRHSVARERQADYVGLYVMARAGFDIEVAAQLWRRMAALMPRQAKSALPTHPAPPERMTAMEQTVAEIKAKQAGGQPLLPDQATLARLGQDTPAAAANRD